MMAEHILYTAAIILIIGIYYTRYTGRTYYWSIILFGSLLADLDHFNNIFWDAGIVPWEVQIVPILKLGLFHNILWLLILSMIVATILSYKRLTFWEAAILCGFGYTIHLVEDFISYPPVYQMLYPVWKQPLGINIIPETKNLIWAGTEVLEIGIVFLVFSFMAYMYHRNGSLLITDKEEE